MDRITLTLFFTVIIFSCQKKEREVGLGKLTYTTSDTALYHFYRGWQQIMDEGDWTGSEASYRNSMVLDVNFLIVMSLVGRITSDSSERIALHREINEKKSRLKGVERELLEAYNASLGYIIERDRGKSVRSETRKYYMNLSEQTLGAITHKYPEEPYTKAEYIEFLHSLYGAQTALDSLNILATDKQKQLGFYITYSALLHSELGQYSEALSKMETYLSLYSDTTFSSSDAYYAQIYFDMDSMELARDYIEHALVLEPNHIIAQRLKAKIEKALLP